MACAADSPISRRALVAGTVAALTAESVAWAKSTGAPRLEKLSIESDGAAYSGDDRLLATVCPGQGTDRRRVFVRFRLDRPATVILEAIKTGRRTDEVVWKTKRRLKGGRHRLAWTPDPSLPARTYLLRLTVKDRKGRTRLYGTDRPYVPWRPQAPVVRILGIEGAFTARSYAPGQKAELVVSADTRRLTVELFRVGPEEEPTFKKNEMKGVRVTDPVKIDWRRNRNRPGRVPIRIGDWPSALYFARLTADDGRVGFAPFIVRPGVFGRRRVAVVLPTNTWQAYNFRDANGDGWGDTWYQGGSPPVLLDRPYLNRGVPFRFKSYDLGFLHWLNRHGKEVEFLADDDVERFRRGDALAAAYDLVVFPGHTEYVTTRAYDIVERYRNLGGNLMFLSANNFFWRISRKGHTIRREKLWRDSRRPESALIGVQYIAGSPKWGSYVVSHDSPAWPWEGTGVSAGDAFGSFGIEIDARTPASPPGVQVLATIPDVFGPGKTAEMTYYESESGARVYAAGSLNFGGAAEQQIVRKLFENVWQRLSPA